VQRTLVVARVTLARRGPAASTSYLLITYSGKVKLMRTLLVTLTAAVLLAPAALPAQAPPATEQARGTVQSLADDTLVLKADDGRTETIKMAKEWRVSVLKPVDVSAIQPGSFIGTAEMPQKGNTGRSLEVHVFPPGAKQPGKPGPGEGHYPWDVAKGSMMTNGTVGKVTAGAAGRELRVSYANGERRIIVPPGVPIVQITNGERSQVKPGIPVFMLVAKAPDGTLTSGFVSIGENGAKPPM
jgi:hypothetical protein